jgi:sec-independent protein translocase protein TatB
MLDVGWPELLVIAIVLVVVVGPKDLPRMLRTFGKSTAKLRSMANDFRRQFDEALKEAELDDVKSVIDSTRKLDPTAEIRKQLNPINKIGDEIKSGLSSATKAPEKPASSIETAASPSSETASSSKSSKSAASKPAAAKAKSASPAKKSGSGTKKAVAAKTPSSKAKTEKQS